MKFERLGCFTYSHEENTHAYTMKDDVPEDVKKRRADEVMALQAGISQELNFKHIGKEFKVIVDRCEGGFWIGRTEYDSPDVDNEVRIAVSDKYHLRIGDFVQVKVTGATAFDVDAELLLDERKMANTYPIMEVFPTLQGEGKFTGHPAYFIRLAGCDVGCSWCADMKESWPADEYPLLSAW